MPRTSYGGKKRNQAWQLVAALMERQGTHGVQLHRKNREAHLLVEASLLDMATWSKLTLEGVREALNQHLGERFLGIVIDQRKQKAGRGAEQWKFELKLWSTDQVENQQYFETAWQVARSGGSSTLKGTNPQTSPSNSLTSPQQEEDTHDWLQQVREQCRQKILNQHSRMRLLSGDEIGVDQLYVDVWLLNRSPRTFQVSPSKLLKTFDLRNDRLGLGDRIQRNPGLKIANQNPKLVILGKPGSGKTTFLKHLAVDWCKGLFQPHLVLVLLELRQIRDEQWYLLNAISINLGLKDHEQVKSLLSKGNLLILMDGLDEVRTNELRRSVTDQIQKLVEEYPLNRLILTCRTQIIESLLSGFTLAEIAEFNPEQVKQFVQNWLSSNGNSQKESTRKWEIFRDSINKNISLKELTVTPVILSLMCLVLQDEGEIPLEIDWLYEKGIRLLLNKWNDAKETEGWEIGNQIYRDLNTKQKEDLLIWIAANKFEDPKNFVLFDREEILTHITQFLKLEKPSDSLAILKAIETHHGLLIERADELWSFSHLTFQEHFTIRWLTQLPSEQLASKISNRQWQRIIKEFARSGQAIDRLLMMIKKAVDYSISNNRILQDLLTWVLEKSRSIPKTLKNYQAEGDPDEFFEQELIRALYFTLCLQVFILKDYQVDLVNELTEELDIDIDNHFLGIVNPEFSKDISNEIELDFSLAYIYNLEYDAYYSEEKINSNLEYILTYAKSFDRKLANKLEHLKNKIRRGINIWIWLEEFRQAVIECRNLGQRWEFNDEEKFQLKTYFETIIFIAQLLKITGISRKVNGENTHFQIRSSLLLPWKEIQYPHVRDI